MTKKEALLSLCGGVVLLALVGACAKPLPYKEPVAVTPPTGEVAITQTVTIFDASGSKEEDFADAKATLESLVAAMPEGGYSAEQVHFGGRQRAIAGGDGFDREALAGAASEAAFLAGSTPLYSVIETEVTEVFEDGSGRAAVVIVSDGLATDYAGREDVDGRTLDAARALVESRGGEVCFHSVQVGESQEGAVLLRSLSETTECGSFTPASSLGSATALQAFSREAYLESESIAVIDVAAAPPDTDGDGVIDPQDECPGTLRAASVDERGCWSLDELRFAVDGAGIEAGFEQSLAEDVAVLQANPDVRIRVDGYTDSDGPAAYNQQLSERRASAVRDYFVSAGLDADRFEVQGFGEENPVAPNDSDANKRRNRRVELTILD